MADNDDQQTEGVDGEGAEDDGAGGGKKKLIILGAAGLVLIALIGGAVWWFLLREPPVDSEAVTDGEDQVEGEAASGDDAEGGDGPTISGPAGGPAEYVSVRPPLLTTYFQGERVRNFQLKSTLVTRDADTANAIRSHMPRIADAFAIRLRQMSLKQVMDPQVRLDLREQLTTIANEVLTEAKLPAKVEATLFEQVVVQ